METQSQAPITDVVMTMSNDVDGLVDDSHQGTLKKGTRQRLLQGIQRIASSPSLTSLRRSRSLSNPYKNRTTISCVSLASSGPPRTPTSGRSSTPQSSPLGLAASSSSTLPTSSSEFPFFDASQDLPAARVVSSTHACTSATTAAVPDDLRLVKPEAFVKHTISTTTVESNPPCMLWETIPHELQIGILTFLEPKELVRISRVSKSFYRLCFDGQLWTSFDASEFYMDIPAAAVTRIVVAAGPFIHHLNLRGCVQVEHYKRTESIVKSCKNLISARFEGCRNMQKSSLQTLLRNNHSLVNLDLTGLSAMSNASCRIIAEFCPQLESLNVSWCEKVEARGLKSIIESCPKLKDLRAGEVRGFDSMSTAETIFGTNNLERLVLSGCVELTDEALMTMIRGPNPEFDILTGRPDVPVRNFRHLDLSRCAGLSDTGVECIGHLTPHLEGLQLSGCKSLSDSAIEPILASTPRLTHLDLEDLDELTNTLFSEHLAKAPCAQSLEHLSISYCENIGDAGIVPVMQKCTALRTVDLDNTRISDLVLAEAAFMVSRRSQKAMDAQHRPTTTLLMAVYDCQNVTWTGIREVLYRNAQVKPSAIHPGHTLYPTEAVGLKCFYGFQMTVDEHQKRVLKSEFASARRLERKWADYMQATEEAGMIGAGHRRRRRRAREAQTLHLDEEDTNPAGRRRARTLNDCTVM